MYSIKLVSTKGMPREEWLEWRRKGIGGSDASAICGVNKWKSGIRVYLEKLGEIEQQIDPNTPWGKEGFPSESAYWRTRMENMIAEEFMKRSENNFGRILKPRKRNYIFQNEQYPWMLANIDRDIVGENAGLEIKTTSAYCKDDWKEGNVPDEYYIQCHHYMAVMGYGKWYIACLIGGQYYEDYCIERDERVIDRIIDLEHDFWNTNIKQKIMPPPDRSDDYTKVLSEMHFDVIKKGCIKIPTLKSVLLELDETKTVQKELEKKRQTLEQQIKFEMGRNEIAIVGDREIKWKADKNGKRRFIS